MCAASSTNDPKRRNAADLQVTLRDVAIITRASLLDSGNSRALHGSSATQDTTPAEIAIARHRLDLAARNRRNVRPTDYTCPDRS